MGLVFFWAGRTETPKKLHPTLTRFGIAQTHLLREFLCSGRRVFPQQQILYTAVQMKPLIWQEIQPILAFIHSLNYVLKRRACYSFALSKAVLKCLFLMEQGDRHQEEASCVWRAEFLADGSRAAAVCTENTHVFTYLGLPCGKHHKRRFTTRGKEPGFDSRDQDAALLSLCSGCCRWMSHRAGKRSTLIMELHQFVTVPEISWGDADLHCSVSTTGMRTAPPAQHQAEPPELPVRLEFPWQHPVPFLPLPTQGTCKGRTKRWHVLASVPAVEQILVQGWPRKTEPEQPEPNETEIRVHI